MQNCIADRAAESFYAYYKKMPSLSERRSWGISLTILNNSFYYADLKDDYIIVEYELPFASKRIDVILFGKDKEDKENVIILELKQWSNDSVRESKFENNVRVRYEHGWEEKPHPSLQIEGYYFSLKDFLKIFQEENAPE